jgi:hypothetical protein
VLTDDDLWRMWLRAEDHATSAAHLLEEQVPCAKGDGRPTLFVPRQALLALCHDVKSLLNEVRRLRGGPAGLPAGPREPPPT